MLADLYGEQRLLHEALLPPELVFGNPGFLRPCHGVRVPGDCYLHALRRRPRALAERAVVGDRRPHAGAVGRGLCAREPDRDVAHPARGVPRLPRAAARRLLPVVPRHAAPARADDRPAAHRAAHAGAVQRDLLRARLSRALPRLHARRGRRPHRARRPRLPEDALGPAARGRDPAPPGRRLLRSARAARRVGARHAGAHAGGARGQRRGGQRARQRAGRDRRHDGVPARACAARCSARSCACRRWPPGGAASPPSAST